MLPESQLLFAKLAKVSDLTLNNALLKNIDAKIASDRFNTTLWQAKETICRRSGKLQAACDANQMIKDKNSTYWTKRHIINAQTLKPEAQKNHPEFKAAPLYILNNFLSPNAVSELLEYTDAQQNEYRPANINYKNPAYVPEKRSTLVLHKKNHFQHYFLNYIEQNIDSLCDQLAVPKFKIKNIEIKLSNHLDKGFFQVHSDNYGQSNHSGRAISWLYYYHKQPKLFEGGNLFVFDTNTDTQFYDEGNFTMVEPINNRFVAFPSYYYHAVSPVTLSTNNFIDGRLACTGHICFGK